MIGKVSGRKPLINITLILPNKPRITLEFVVDTGFDGLLMLSPEAVKLLDLPYLYSLDANLADGRKKSATVHGAMIEWDGQERIVEVLAMGNRPLAGTLLMDQCELLIQFSETGIVTIDPL